jgi:type IV pilus assembly protein PilW
MYQQKGLSLIELMISITLGLILMTGVVQMFLSSKTTFATQQGVSRVQETGRLSVDFIAKDLRMAGYAGLGSRLVRVVNSTGAAATVFNNYVDGVSVLAAPQAGLGLAGTDMLIIRGALNSNSAPLTAATSVTGAGVGTLTTALVSEEAGGCGVAVPRYNGICLIDTLVVSDYKKSYVFIPTGITKLNATTVTINYAGTWGGDPINPNQFFTIGARVSATTNVAYYIDTGTSGRPSLFQQINGVNPLELLEGVSDMSIAYSRANTPTNFVSAVGALGGLWNNVANSLVGIRIDLLTESIENNVLESPQQYTFAGTAITGNPADATDRRLHQTFSTTIALRNQKN